MQDFDDRLKRQILSDLDDAERAIRSIRGNANVNDSGYVSTALRAIEDAISKVKKAEPTR